MIATTGARPTTGITPAAARSAMLRTVKPVLVIIIIGTLQVNSYTALYHATVQSRYGTRVRSSTVTNLLVQS